MMKVVIIKDVQNRNLLYDMYVGDGWIGSHGSFQNVLIVAKRLKLKIII